MGEGRSSVKGESTRGGMGEGKRVGKGEVEGGQGGYIGAVGRERVGGRVWYRSSGKGVSRREG